MDKYAWYVIVVYVVTFTLLGGYLVWMWLRLRLQGRGGLDQP